MNKLIFVFALLCLWKTTQNTCLCPINNYNPQCGRNGRTYMNYCLMLCDNVRRDHKGPCKVCKCPDVLSPVCANDGQTYVNSCEANCKEVLVLHEGRCRNRNNDNP